MNFNFEFVPSARPATALADVPEGARAVVERFRLPAAVSDHLMNLGMVPGLEVAVVRSVPGGDPRIYRVDGADIAIRREVSQSILVRPAAASGD